MLIVRLCTFCYLCASHALAWIKVESMCSAFCLWWMQWTYPCERQSGWDQLITHNCLLSFTQFSPKVPHTLVTTWASVKKTSIITTLLLWFSPQWYLYSMSVEILSYPGHGDLMCLSQKQFDLTSWRLFVCHLKGFLSSKELKFFCH